MDKWTELGYGQASRRAQIVTHEYRESRQGDRKGATSHVSIAITQAQKATPESLHW